MTDWRVKILNELNDSVQENIFWNDYLNSLPSQGNHSFSIHLGVFVEPFLQYILDGRKTIETRFSSVRCAPFGRVHGGDIILLKKTGGPIVGICQISIAWNYQLEKNSWGEIKTYASEICAEDPMFWEKRKDASFATLMRIQNVQTISPIKIAKRDRRGWVVLREASRGL